MKTRLEFLEDFFTRLRNAGFRVDTLPDGDLAAEVYAGNPLLCVITRDGEIIYETYDADNARSITQAAEETRRTLDCHIAALFGYGAHGAGQPDVRFLL